MRRAGTNRNTYAEGHIVATNTLGMEPSAPPASAPGLDNNRPDMSMIGGHGGRLEREIERDR